jgi:hypothetical protein
MNNEFESSGGEQNIAQGDHAIGGQIRIYSIPTGELVEIIPMENEVEHEKNNDENQIIRKQESSLQESGEERQESEQSLMDEKNSSSLSIKYIQQLTAGSRNVKFALVITIVIFFAVDFGFQQNISYFLLFILLCFLGLLIAREHVLEYRIRKGLFGTNRTEARELIDFIIKNSDNLDFTDSNGNLRRALLPEAKDTAEEYVSSTLGEEARA